RPGRLCRYAMAGHPRGNASQPARMVTLLLGALAGMASSVVANWVVHGGAAGIPRFALAVSRACPLAGLAQSVPCGLQQTVNSDPTDSWSARHRQRRAHQISGADASLRSSP